MKQFNDLITVNKARCFLCFLFVCLSLGEHDITCNVTKCRSKDISELIIQSSNSNDLNDLKRPTRIKKFCSELIASDGYVKKVYIRYEQKKQYTAQIILCPEIETEKYVNVKTQGRENLH